MQTRTVTSTIEHVPAIRAQNQGVRHPGSAADPPPPPGLLDPVEEPVLPYPISRPSSRTRWRSR